MSRPCHGMRYICHRTTWPGEEIRLYLFMITFFDRHTTAKTIVCFLIAFFLLQLPRSAKAFTLRKINKVENLSSPRVFSFHQDEKGILWIGTARGVDRYDGKQVFPYYPEHDGDFFTGNKIENIRQTEDKFVWFQTYRGLYKIDPATSESESFSGAGRIAFWDRDSLGNLFLMHDDARIYYKRQEQVSFEQSDIPGLGARAVADFFLDKAGRVWIICKDGACLCFSVRFSEQGRADFLPLAGYRHPAGIRYATHDADRQVYLADDTDALFELDTASGKARFIGDLKKQPTGKDDITSLLKFHDDYFIGYETGGLSLLKKRAGGYAPEEIDIPGGINCLYRDKYQDMVWIGTAGEGVYTYAAGPYSVRSFRLRDFTPDVRQPVSALLIDKENTLWLGSKGDGILRIFDFRPDKNIAAHRVELLTASNSGLQDNAIFSFSVSPTGNIWIGSRQGLSCFLQREGRVVPVELAYGERKVGEISDLYEQDSLLWIATQGMGVIKARLAWRSGQPVVTPVKQLAAEEKEEYARRFQKIYPENDSILWCTGKEGGLYRLHTAFAQLQPVRWKGNAPREINGLCKDGQGDYLIGTNAGLLAYRPADDSVWHKGADLPPFSVYGIMPEGGAGYWLGTNRGLLLYNAESESGRVYDYRDGLAVGEFTEGACCKEEETGLFLWGATDGFVAVRRDYFDEGQHYMPPVYFKTITLKGKQYPVEKFLSREGEDVRLTLGPGQNFFTLSFAATDHLNGNSYAYYYRLGGDGKEWTYNGNSDVLSFADLRPGDYILYVKYYNRALGKESYRYKLAIKVFPPWYASPWAYGAYVLLAAGVLLLWAGVRRRSARKEKARQLQKAEQKRKEEIYESKLQFFTHISHEFCTPLTLIYGPCNRLMEQKGLSESAKKYTSVIQQNAERLNTLIQELIEFNRIESGYKKPVIAPVDIAAVATRLIGSFEEAAESHAIGVDKKIPSRLTWNSDKDFIETILLNLLSNAFKYAAGEKRVRVEAGSSSDNAWITVSNTGKGIAEKDVPALFDRYRVLQYFEQKDKAAWGAQHGLGLAISYRLVRLLGGTIEVESVRDGWTHFRIKLPPQEAQEATPVPTESSSIPANRMEFGPALQIPSYDPDGLKPTLLIVDDEMEIRWFLLDLFKDEYNVLTAGSAAEALELLKDTHPDLILSDVRMPGMDGLSFSRQVKADETTAHIPFILLSARGDMEGRAEGLDAGAELYITKPFHVDYIKSSVRRLLERKESLRAYFSSPLSVYELDKGKFSHAEHRKFVREILKIVNRNIRNKDLSAPWIAEKMHLGLRTFYRRLEAAEGVALTELITNCRVVKAADLLVKTKLTIDEIVFQAGFTNRSTFYRAFSKKYGCTPTAYRKEPGAPSTSVRPEGDE